MLLSENKPEIPSIEDSLEESIFDDNFSFPSVESRYFQRYSSVVPETPDEKSKSGPQCVMVHSNRICLVTLAKSHPVIQEAKEIERVNFQVNF